MKKLSILLILLLLLSIDTFSQKSQPVAYAVFKDSTLTFYYGKKKPQGAYYVEKMVRVQRIATSYYTKEWDSVRNKLKPLYLTNPLKISVQKVVQDGLPDAKILLQLKA